MSQTVVGTTIIVQWIDATGTLAIQGEYTEFSFPRSVDKADITAGANTSKDYLPTIADYTFKMKGFWDDASGALGTASLARLKEGKFGTLRFGVKGTAAGKPKGEAYVFVEKQDHSYPYNDAATVDLEWQCVGGTGLIHDPNVDAWP
jgi:hypothetical protein